MKVILTKTAAYERDLRFLFQEACACSNINILSFLLRDPTFTIHSDWFREALTNGQTSSQSAQLLLADPRLSLDLSSVGPAAIRASARLGLIHHLQTLLSSEHQHPLPLTLTLALTDAIQTGQAECATLILADTRVPKTLSVLHLAVKHGLLPIVHLLLHNHHIRPTNHDYTTAASLGHLDILKCLNEIDSISSRRFQVFRAAIQHQQPLVLRYLVDQFPVPDEHLLTNNNSQLDDLLLRTSTFVLPRIQQDDSKAIEWSTTLTQQLTLATIRRGRPIYFGASTRHDLADLFLASVHEELMDLPSELVQTIIWSYLVGFDFPDTQRST